MKIRVLQLNIFKGKFLSEIIDYIKKNQFDIIHLQEVSGGSLSNGGIHIYPSYIKHTGTSRAANPEAIGIDLFQEIKNRLGTEYLGELVKTYKHTTDSDSYFGNATFYKKNFSVIKKDDIWLSPFNEIAPDFKEWQFVGRAALALTYKCEGKQFMSINGHFAWGPHPEDEEYKIEQAQKLYYYLKNNALPFIFTGDLNVVPHTKTAQMFEDFGRNLTKEYHITNTLNFNIHPAQQLFPPGLAVDYIFVSPEIKVEEFRLIDSPDLSDHYGLMAEVKF